MDQVVTGRELEIENWRLMATKRNWQPIAASNKFYVKINEEEIVNDYPLPAYYKPTARETGLAKRTDSDGTEPYSYDTVRVIT
ncbi:hypothetical protein QYF36_007331 [Acer negundo]|nr:hypothetical protein QYF36_007331 [Acer negundo]